MEAYRDEVDEIAKCFLGSVPDAAITQRDMLSKLGCGENHRPAFSWSIADTLDQGANPKIRCGSVSGKGSDGHHSGWRSLSGLPHRSKLPEDEVLATIIRQARSYTIVDGQLYKRSATGYFSNASPIKMALKSSERSMQGIAGITPLPGPSLPKLSGLDFTGSQLKKMLINW
ncbi:hypothetical protein QYE76_069899 [Lolium multiflorum]|uniref:Uncharacterized protein n=1 Tax=Lolium multiflorum TaxID=4521 RepID=A0AAD8SHX9_LOLMU|nr:hypothetical protein QYE76_069899 [Lolium multiflorum]